VSVAAKLLAELRDYEVAVPVRVDQYGAVFKPSTSTRLVRSTTGTDRRTRRSPHSSTTLSPSVDDDGDVSIDISASSRGKSGLLFIHTCT